MGIAYLVWNSDRETVRRKIKHWSSIAYGDVYQDIIFTMNFVSLRNTLYSKLVTQFRHEFNSHQLNFFSSVIALSKIA